MISAPRQANNRYRCTQKQAAEQRDAIMGDRNGGVAPALDRQNRRPRTLAYEPRKKDGARPRRKPGTIQIGNTFVLSVFNASQTRTSFFMTRGLSAQGQLNTPGPQAHSNRHTRTTSPIATVHTAHTQPQQQIGQRPARGRVERREATGERREAERHTHIHAGSHQSTRLSSQQLDNRRATGRRHN